MVAISRSSAEGDVGSIPGWGAGISHDSRPRSQNVKQKQYCNKFNKDFKNGPHQKIIIIIIQINVYTKQKQTHRYRIQTCGYQRGEGRGERQIRRIGLRNTNYYI